MIDVLEFILVVVLSVAMMFYVFAQSFNAASTAPPLGLPFYAYAALPFLYLAVRIVIRRVSARQRQR